MDFVVHMAGHCVCYFFHDVSDSVNVLQLQFQQKGLGVAACAARLYGFATKPRVRVLAHPGNDPHPTRVQPPCGIKPILCWPAARWALAARLFSRAGVFHRFPEFVAIPPEVCHSPRLSIPGCP